MFGNVTLTTDAMGIFSVNFNNFDLDDANFMKMILKLLFMSNFWFGTTSLKNARKREMEPISIEK